MDACGWFVLRMALHCFCWLLTIRVDRNGRRDMWWLLVVHRLGIVRYFHISYILTAERRWSKCIRGSLSWHCWRDIQKSLVNPPPRQSNVHTQLSSGKPGSLKTMSINLSERVSIRFASLYVDSPLSCFYRSQIYCHTFFFSWDIGSLSF